LSKARLLLGKPGSRFWISLLVRCAEGTNPKFTAWKCESPGEERACGSSSPGRATYQAWMRAPRGSPSRPLAPRGRMRSVIRPLIRVLDLLGWTLQQQPLPQPLEDILSAILTLLGSRAVFMLP